jgi:hypothetical protein
LIAKRTILTTFVIFFLASCLCLAQTEDRRNRKKLAISPSLGVEYFSRTISWDDDMYNSNLKSLFFILSADYEIVEGIEITGLIGYSLSNFDSLTFRNLPISVELGVGNISGYIVGGNLKVSLFPINNVQIIALGEFVHSFGSYEEWPFEELSVEGGIVTGMPSWSRLKIGPVIEFRNQGSLLPFIHLYFDSLWGHFKIEEDILELKGEEKKEIKGKSHIGISAGTHYQIIESISLLAQANLWPYSGGVDWGISARIRFAF